MIDFPAICSSISPSQKYNYIITDNKIMTQLQKNMVGKYHFTDAGKMGAEKDSYYV